jgi:hypothetical protein
LMVKSAEDGPCNDLAELLDGTNQRRILGQRQMRPNMVVQHDDRTPTGPRRASFFTHGTPGQGAWFTFMR